MIQDGIISRKHAYMFPVFRFNSTWCEVESCPDQRFEEIPTNLRELRKCYKHQRCCIRKRKLSSRVLQYTYDYNEIENSEQRVVVFTAWRTKSVLYSL